MLPKLKIPNSGKSKLEIHFKIGVSSKLFDLDNFLKPFLDILQKKYLFDDKMINKLVAEKEIVKKGAEFISFEIKKYEQPDIKTRS